MSAVTRALVRESMERDRRRLVAALRKAEDMPQASRRKRHEREVLIAALRKAEDMPQASRRKRHEREVLIGRRTRELEAHERLIEGYGA